eukprot:scaffold169075_cov44-Attheya_sp.AAC.1
MDDNDDEYSGNGNRQERQGYSQYNNPPHNALTIQAAMELEQEIYLRQQLEMQRDMHVRRRLLQEQQHHILSEIDHNMQFQHMQRHHDISSPLVHQQRMFDLPYGASAAHHQLRLHEEQAYLEDQRHRMLQQHQQHQQARANIGLPSIEAPSHLTEEATNSLIRSQLTGSPITSRPERSPNSGASDPLRGSKVMDHQETASKPTSAVAESAPAKRKRQRKKTIDKSEKGSKRSAPDKSKTAVAEVTSNCSSSPSDQDKTKGLLDALNHIEENDQRNFDIHVKIASQILTDSKESASGETELGGRENGNSIETVEAEAMDISADDQKTAEEREVGAIIGLLHGQDPAPNQSSKKSEEASSTQREVATLIANLQKADVSVDPVYQDRKSSADKKSNASDMITGIVLPGFTSTLPQLPVEPEFCEEDIVIQRDIYQEALNSTDSDTILTTQENSSSNGVNHRSGNLPLIAAQNRDSATTAKSKSGSSKQQL